ncbi:hypothetical protein [Cetobacterium sp.]|uniref:hypothetical protein n=1 Tax=Cetobacterium sp. TaxID=2071632 RepID=UPI003F365399
MAKYIFIVNDIIYPKQTFYAKDTIKLLFDEKIWLFKESHVPHMKNLKKDDEIILYVAGANRRYFYCTFILDSSIELFNKKNQKLYTLFSNYVKIKDIKYFNEKIYLKPMVANLKFIKDKKNYGLFFRGAVRKITDDDYNQITSDYSAANL